MSFQGRVRETRKRQRLSIITAAPDRRFSKYTRPASSQEKSSSADFSFRAYPGAAPSFFFSNTVNISDVVIQLSTTSAGADESGLLPSATFADNLGGDATTVYSGALTLTTAATGIGAQPFDYTVTFSQPFLQSKERNALTFSGLLRFARNDERISGDIGGYRGYR